MTSPLDGRDSTEPSSVAEDVPQLPLRTLKPIAPKPTPRVSSEPAPRGSAAAATSSVSRASRSRACPVCLRHSCRLESHKQFTKDKRLRDQPRQGSSRTLHLPSDDTVYAESYAYRFAKTFVDTSLAASRVDPFIDLPIPDSTHPQLHRLFHDFFTVQLDRAVNFPRPSCFTSDLLGGAIASTAIVDPLVCLGVVAASAATAGMRAGQQARNTTALSLFSQALKVLKERLTLNPRTPSDETLMAAATMWLVSILFGDKSAVRSHGKAVRDLVGKRGGLRMLGFTGLLAQYVSWTDVFSALLLKEAPTLERCDPPLIPPELPRVYGARLYSPLVADLHPVLTEICRSACRLTELLEKALGEGVHSQEYIYFYTKLKSLSCDRAEFLATCHNSGTVDDCIANAIEIYRINVFSTQPENRNLTLDFCSHLYTALSKTDLASFWNNQADLLIWILFIVSTISYDFETKDWFVDLLQRATAARYEGQDWPPGWEEDELENLRGLVWSDVRFSGSFTNTCMQLGRQSKQRDTLPSSLTQNADILATLTSRTLGRAENQSKHIT